MIALPAGVTVHAGGRKWVKEIPEALCPDQFKPVAAPVPQRAKAQPAAPAEEEKGE